MGIAHRKKPPSHLSAEACGIWKAILAEYGIDDAGGRVILEAGLESFDRMRQAQEAIRTEGTTVRDRFGQVQVHPGVRIERDSRAAWLAALKQLNLDLEPINAHPGRPPGR